MKKTTLIFRSLGILVLLTGIAHLFSLAAQKNTINTIADETVTMDSSSAILENVSEEGTLKSQGQTTSPTTMTDNRSTDYIIGQWRVTYNSEAFKGAIIYNIKKEGNVFNAYTHQYEDDRGYTQKGEGTKALMIKTFDGYTAKGTYIITYEGGKIRCELPDNYG